MFKAKANASKRTKNRFREHTLIVGARMEDTNEPVTTIFKFGELQGKECISMQSLEEDTKFVTPEGENDPNWRFVPRWMGWIPLNEIEEVEEE